MPVYLELFHGRESVGTEMDDWGSQGPILGPLSYVHTTYAADIKLETIDGTDGVLCLCGEEQADLIYYDGTYYGDWSVFGDEALQHHPASRRRVQQFDCAKACPDN